MGDIGSRHIATYQDGIRVVRTDGWMKHRPASAGANDLEIAWTGVYGLSQQKTGYRKSKKEKDHLFLFFTFVTIVSLSFCQKFRPLSMLMITCLDLYSQKLRRIFKINFLQYYVG